MKECSLCLLVALLLSFLPFSFLSLFRYRRRPAYGWWFVLAFFSLLVFLGYSRIFQLHASVVFPSVYINIGFFRFSTLSKDVLRFIRSQ